MAIRFPVVLALGLAALAGCGEKPNKAAVEKKVRDELAKSPAYKDVAVEMKLDGTLTTAGANRDVDGKAHWLSFTGSKKEGGVAVRGPAGEWLCKYGFDGDKKEKSAEKMAGGTDADVAKFRPVAAEFAAACMDASP